MIVSEESIRMLQMYELPYPYPHPNPSFPLRKTRLELDDGTGVGGDTGPQVGALFRDGTVDGRTLHLALGVGDGTGVVLEVQENTVSAAPGLALTAHDGGHDCLCQYTYVRM